MNDCPIKIVDVVKKIYRKNGVTQYECYKYPIKNWKYPI